MFTPKGKGLRVWGAVCGMFAAVALIGCGQSAPDENPENAGGIPGADATMYGELVDPRPASWKEDYPLFIPAETGDGSLEAVQSGGITVCVNDAAPPFTSSSADGEMEGIEVELLQFVTQKLGIPEIRYSTAEWQALIPALLANQCDVAMTGIGVRSDRAEVASFAYPYFRAYDQIAISTSSDIDAVEDLKGAKIGALSGSTDYWGAVELVEQLGEGTQLVEFNMTNDCLLATQNGTIDACFADNSAIVSAIDSFGGLRVVGDPFPWIPTGDYAKDATINPYILGAFGLVLRKESGDLDVAISVAIDDWISSGEQEKVLSSYGLWSDDQAELVRADA